MCPLSYLLSLLIGKQTSYKVYIYKANNIVIMSGVPIAKVNWFTVSSSLSGDVRSMLHCKGTCASACSVHGLLPWHVPKRMSGCIAFNSNQIVLWAI